MNVDRLLFLSLTLAGCAGLAGDTPRSGKNDDAGSGGATGGAGEMDATAGSGGSGNAGAGTGVGGTGSGPMGTGGAGATGGAAGKGGATGGTAGSTGGTAGNTGGTGTGASSGGGSGGNGGATEGGAGTLDAGSIVDVGGKGGMGGTGPICDAQPGTGTSVPDAPAQCTSGRKWTSGNGPTMSPGDICQGCHGFTIAGTVYPTVHETGLCYGVNGGAQVVITPSCGTPISLTVNSAGNFYYTGSVRLPFTAKVVVNGAERVMLGPQTLGDCNACHSQNGLQGAPGRIIVP
ncbi:MAG TPA: hypothetical protein VK550_11535 [Polyangiaceae bacterium]|nr:hypothetical protein [Polyangiaceae bacterium]